MKNWVLLQYDEDDGLGGSVVAVFGPMTEEDAKKRELKEWGTEAVEMSGDQ